MTVFIWISFFWTHSILLVYVIFHLERSSSEAPTSFGKSLVFWFNFTSSLCDGLCLKELVFMPFWFCMHSWCSVQKEAVLRLLLAVGEPWCFDQSVIDSVLNLLLGNFMWRSLLWWVLFFLDPFDVLWLFDVPFWKKLLADSCHYCLKPCDSISRWLIPSRFFKLSQVFSVWLSLFEFSFGFSTHLLLLAYVMFRLERGCSQLLPSIGWTLVLRVVND